MSSDATPATESGAVDGVESAAGSSVGGSTQTGGAPSATRDAGDSGASGMDDSSEETAGEGGFRDSDAGAGGTLDSDAGAGGVRDNNAGAGGAAGEDQRCSCGADPYPETTTLTLECFCMPGIAPPDATPCDTTFCKDIPADVNIEKDDPFMPTVLTSTGCGINAVLRWSAYYSEWQYFDAETGTLVGMKRSNDTSAGACRAYNYVAGQTHEGCDSVEPCTPCGMEPVPGLEDAPACD